MKEFHFSKTYFKMLTYDDREANIRVIIKEIPSLEISEEEYSLRVETHHEEENLIHRHYAIEHHSQFDKHHYPHLQFKFHTEEIGTFWLRLDFESPAEYKRAILGFIYKMKEVIQDLERLKKGITNDTQKGTAHHRSKTGGMLASLGAVSFGCQCFPPQPEACEVVRHRSETGWKALCILVLDLVDMLSEEGAFLTGKITESITKYLLEFQNDGFARDKANKLAKNKLLLDFLGEENVSKVIKSYSIRKRNKL